MISESTRGIYCSDLNRVFCSTNFRIRVANTVADISNLTIDNCLMVATLLLLIRRLVSHRI